MKINQEEADRLKEIHQKVAELVEEFKQICRTTMTRPEYDQFKYRCLGNLEPGINNETDWVTTYSSIDSLEKIAERAADEVVGEECDVCADPECKGCPPPEE